MWGKDAFPDTERGINTAIRKCVKLSKKIPISHASSLHQDPDWGKRLPLRGRKVTVYRKHSLSPLVPSIAWLRRLSRLVSQLGSRL